MNEDGILGRAFELADLVSDMIWGGERGWEIATTEQFNYLKDEARKRMYPKKSFGNMTIPEIWNLLKNKWRISGAKFFIRSFLSAFAAIFIAVAFGNLLLDIYNNFIK